jgi:hypothetical protein
MAGLTIVEPASFVLSATYLSVTYLSVTSLPVANLLATGEGADWACV